MIEGKDITRYFDVGESCPICKKLGVFWTYFQDPGWEDEGYPLPEEINQLVTVEGQKEELEGLWIKKCPDCGRVFRYSKHLTYCIHYCQEEESCMQVDYWNLLSLLGDSKSILTDLKKLYERENLITLLKAVICEENRYPNHRDTALKYLIELNLNEAIFIMQEYREDSNPVWRQYISKMFTLYGADNESKRI